MVLLFYITYKCFVRWAAYEKIYKLHLYLMKILDNMNQN
jgi:hypothetical protein